MELGTKTKLIRKLEKSSMFSKKYFIQCSYFSNDKSKFFDLLIQVPYKIYNEFGL